MPNLFRTRRLLGSAMVGLLVLTAALASAQSVVPLRIILPVGAGSGVDTIMRAAQGALSRALDGQPVVIENLPGAGGIPGTSAIVRAAPDGNTVGVVSNNHAVNPSVFRKLPYDSISDLTPISVIGETPFVLVVNPAKVPVRNARELQAFLKAAPGRYNYASSGTGTVIHLAGQMIVDAFVADVRHIPYKGLGPMATDLIGGQVEMGVAALPAVQGHIKTGALRAVGITGRSRAPTMPEIPTMVEQGFPDVEVAGWFAVVGPTRMSTAHVKRIRDAFLAAFSDPEVKTAMLKQGNVINPTTSEEAARFFKSEQDRYAQIVKTARLTPE